MNNAQFVHIRFVYNRGSTAKAIAVLLTLLCCPAVDGEARDFKQEVLVYYANESAPEGLERANLKEIARWLRESEIPKVKRIADGLENDGRLFSQAVDAELDVIEPAAVARKLPTIVFTNRLVRRGEYRWYAPETGIQRFQSGQIQRFASDNYIAAANPLAHPEMLRRGLETAASRFSPIAHRFVLVAKSPEVPATP